MIASIKNELCKLNIDLQLYKESESTCEKLLSSGRRVTLNCISLTSKNPTFPEPALFYFILPRYEIVYSTQNNLLLIMDRRLCKCLFKDSNFCFN